MRILIDPQLSSIKNRDNTTTPQTTLAALLLFGASTDTYCNNIQTQHEAVALVCSDTTAIPSRHSTTLLL
jgi:hypothetical protein